MTFFCCVFFTFCFFLLVFFFFFFYRKYPFTTSKIRFDKQDIFFSCSFGRSVTWYIYMYICNVKESKRSKTLSRWRRIKRASKNFWKAKSGRTLSRLSTRERYTRENEYFFLIRRSPMKFFRIIYIHVSTYIEISDVFAMKSWQYF